MGGRRRNKNGLTDKQQQALPIIARAKSRHQGVLECQRLGIVNQTQYYKYWTKEPQFVERLQEERDKYFGEVRSRIKDIFVSYAELLAQRLVSFGLQDGRDRLRAIEDVLGAIGIELGRGSRVDVRTQVVQASQGQGFAERVKDIQEERQRLAERAASAAHRDEEVDSEEE